MISPIQGNLDGMGLHIGIVVSRFNQLITESLLSGANSALRRAHVSESQITIIEVPGAFELPLGCQKLVHRAHCDAIVALGCIIRGQTPHFDYVASQSAAGIMQVGLSSGIPIINGILTTDTIEQAIERAGTKAGNKGEQAAISAIEMANLCRKVKEL